jgi:HAD superfamily hydrolase (TIGR01662 family)
MLVILDLDGTLTPQRPSSVASFAHTLLPGVREKCAELIRSGCVLAIATNQGGLRKGLKLSEVTAILSWISAELGIAECKFASGYIPNRKKPQPGMLLELMREFGIPPETAIFVGDSESDRLAAEAAGVQFEWAADFFRKEQQ